MDRHAPWWTIVLVASLLCVSPEAAAHQPVRDMAPRWEDGFGFQVRHEYRASDDLMDGSSDVSNPFNRKRRVSPPLSTLPNSRTCTVMGS